MNVKEIVKPLEVPLEINVDGASEGEPETLG